jgi:hypothetical protein
VEWSRQPTPSTKTRDLSYDYASNLPTGAIIFLQVESPLQGFLLYVITDKTADDITVSLLTHPNANSEDITAPCTASKIHSDTFVYCLTRKSHACLKAFIAKRECFDVTWPVDFQPYPSDAPSRFDDSSDEEDSNEPAIVTPSADGARFATGLVQLLDDAKSSVAKAKTPAGRMLTLPQAKILSTNPIGVLSAGNINVYHKLYHLAPHSHIPVDTAADAPADLSRIWNLRHWRTHVQPFHLLQLVTDIMTVDIRLFADVYTVRSHAHADQLTRCYLTTDDSLYDDSRSVDLTIIGGYPDRLHTCLLNFCATLDALFQLQPCIRSALFEAVQRVREFVADRSFALSPSEPKACILLHYLAAEFQRTVADMYGLIRGEQIRTAEAAAALIAKFPDRGFMSRFTADIMHINATGTLPDAMCYNVVTPTKKPPATPSGNTPTNDNGKKKADKVTTTVTPEKFCPYWNSTQSCKQGANCRYAHRKPNTDAEKTFLEKFFARYKKLTPVA